MLILYKIKIISWYECKTIIFNIGIKIFNKIYFVFYESIAYLKNEI